MKSIIKAKITLATVTVVFLFTGCSQKDSTVGSGLAGGLSDPQEVIIDPTASAFFQAEATTGDSPFLYVGFLQDYEARTLLKFNPIPVLPDSYAVDSISLTLFTDTSYTSEDGMVDIEVIAVNQEQEWAEIGVTWDTLDSLELGESIALFTVYQTDDSISFTLPSPFDSLTADSLIRAWESAALDEKTLHFNNGIYLQSLSSSASIVRLCSGEYEAVVRRPKLEMFITVYDTSDTTGNYPLLDTVSVQVGGDAFIAKDFVGITDSTRLYLGNAIAHRSLLLFNLEDAFPSSYGIGIHRAEVILHADTSHPANIDHINGGFSLRMADTSWISDPENAPIAFGDVVSITLYDEETATLTLKLNNFVYDWIRYPDTNQGFMFKSIEELADLARTVFYGVDAPDSLKPRMRIVYVEGEL
jgi:hypothetical protein